MLAHDSHSSSCPDQTPDCPRIANGDHYRAMLVDPALIGLSRRLLIDLLGAVPTYQLQVRLGYAHGWRAATALVSRAAGHGPEDRYGLVAPLFVHLGLCTDAHLAPRAVGEEPRLVLAHSAEAEAHRHHCGPAVTSACYFTTAALAGALSHLTGHTVACREDTCAATGATHCTFAISVIEDPAVASPREPTSGDACAYLLSHLGLDEPVSMAPDGSPLATDAVVCGMRSPRMRAVVARADRAAQIDSTVLLTGESGTGKGRLARYIHEHSARARAPFIAVNCGAIQQSLLESELFGHRRGAYTGAIDDRPGLFEAAHHGTIFLDEIGELPAEMQVVLLSVLQDREVRRVGETRCRPIDVRVIAATNRDLTADISARRFRSDLYYRLAVVPLHVPPLRERPDDLRALADLLLAQTATRMRRHVEGYTPRAWDALRAYHWPGNIRELENTIERACAFTSARRIDLADLPDPIRRHPIADPDPVRPLRDVERDHILAALQRAQGNRALAARHLHITERTLYRRLQQYGVPAPDPDRD